MKARCSSPTAKAGISVSSRSLAGSSARWRPICDQRPVDADTERLFVVLKGPRRGHPLSEDGLDEIVRYTRERVGLAHCTCPRAAPYLSHSAPRSGHGLGGHPSPSWAPLHRETTRIYLHLSNEWLADEYARAIAMIDHSVLEAVAQ